MLGKFLRNIRIQLIVCLIVLSAIFSNISAISFTVTFNGGVNHRPVTSHCPKSVNTLNVGML